LLAQQFASLLISHLPPLPPCPAVCAAVATAHAVSFQNLCACCSVAAFFQLPLLLFLVLMVLLMLLFFIFCICSVAAFFQLIGEEWRGLFSEIRTREFKYVKPDKRLLLDVAQVIVTCDVSTETVSKRVRLPIKAGKCSSCVV
jgi:hypothetical protein